MFSRLFFAAIALVLLSSPALARHHHRVAPQHCDFFQPCSTPALGAAMTFGTPQGEVRVHAHRSAGIIGGRPSGCPTQFCGCGASLYLFGRIKPELNLAANWLRFPRATPAPRMAAARRGHVMVLVAHVQGDVWLVHDSNSGGHQTRLHERSITGFTVVNPNA